jgi:hypothetical protein
MVYTIALFYGVRAVLQGIFNFQYIEGTYWQSPGVPSLVVPYGDACDFYYSGHTGFLVLMAIMYWEWGYGLQAAICVFFVFYVIQVLLLFRIHYSIGRELF